MNVNIILDSNYICKELSNPISAVRIAQLFMLMKKKANVIILQDKNQIIIRNIIHQLMFEFEKIEKEDLSDAQIFILELAKGTSSYDFITEEIFDDNISEFVENLKKKEYPIKIVISDKKISETIECYTIEESAKIFEKIENASQKHKVTNNQKLLSDKKNKNYIDFNEYKEVLFNTFWCSEKITIVAKEFFDGYFAEGWKKESNRDRYAEGFKFLFSCLESIENFINKKLNIEIITGLSRFGKDTVNEDGLLKFDSNGNLKMDEIFAFINQSNNKFNISLKIIKWDAGDERFIGEGHGRRIYSDYGCLENEYMPLEIHSKRDRLGKIYHKDTSFAWVGEKSFVKPEKIGQKISFRPQ